MISKTRIISIIAVPLIFWIICFFVFLRCQSRWMSDLILFYLPGIFPFFIAFYLRKSTDKIIDYFCTGFILYFLCGVVLWSNFVVYEKTSISNDLSFIILIIFIVGTVAGAIGGITTSLLALIFRLFRIQKNK